MLTISLKVFPGKYLIKESLSQLNFSDLFFTSSSTKCVTLTPPNHPPIDNGNIMINAFIFVCQSELPLS